MMKIDSYFGNKEISLYHCCEKQKKDYFTILNEKHITENKCFWKTVKPFLSNKVQSSERIKTFWKKWHPEEVAMELNDVFSNAVINLKISKFENLNLCQKT